MDNQPSTFHPQAALDDAAPMIIIPICATLDDMDAYIKLYCADYTAQKRMAAAWAHLCLRCIRQAQRFHDN